MKRNIDIINNQNLQITKKQKYQENQNVKVLNNFSENYGENQENQENQEAFKRFEDFNQNVMYHIFL